MHTTRKMKLIFDHNQSQFDKEKQIPLIYLECITTGESAKEMFETGWIPYYDRWYQTCSSRLEIKPISKEKIKELSKIKIKTNLSKAENEEQIKRFGLEKWTEPYEIDDNSLTFTFDNNFWGVTKQYEDQILFCVMSTEKHKKSYGKLSFYFLIEEFRNKFEHLYISDYFPHFSYKAQLPGFEYWTGEQWKKI